MVGLIPYYLMHYLSHNVIHPFEGICQISRCVNIMQCNNSEVSYFSNIFHPLLTCCDDFILSLELFNLLITV
jgi:hypothetical protein